MFGKVHDLYIHQATINSEKFNPIDSDIEKAFWTTSGVLLASLTEHHYPKTEIEKLRQFLVNQGY
jgi:hypothetical protein